MLHLNLIHQKWEGEFHTCSFLPANFTVGKTLVPYFFGHKVEFFFCQNNFRNLDPFYKTNLGLWDCLGRVKLVI